MITQRSRNRLVESRRIKTRGSNDEAANSNLDRKIRFTFIGIRRVKKILYYFVGAFTFFVVFRIYSLFIQYSLAKTTSESFNKLCNRIRQVYSNSQNMNTYKMFKLDVLGLEDAVRFRQNLLDLFTNSSRDTKNVFRETYQWYNNYSKLTSDGEMFLRRLNMKSVTFMEALKFVTKFYNVHAASK